MGNLWKAEPTMILSVVSAGIALAVGFGAHISTQQMGLIMAFSAAVLGLINRSQVTSPQTLQDMTPKNLAEAQDAAAPVKDIVKKLPVVLLACALVTPFVAGCHANLTPVAAVASPATQVEQTGMLILQAAQSAHAQTNPQTGRPIISTAQLDTVAVACDKIGRLGTTLAQALSDYSAAKDAGSSTTVLAASIQSLVADAVAALNTIGQSIPNGTVAAIDQAVVTAFGIFAQIKAAAL